MNCIIHNYTIRERTTETISFGILIFKAVQNITDTWSRASVRLEPYKDKGIYRVAVDEDVFQSLEDHLVQLSTIKSSKYTLDI